MAPGMEVRPPRISTGSAFSAITSSAKDTSERAPHMMPVTSATMPAANQTITQIWFREMPTESAALWLSATARSARPMRVYWKKKPSTAIISAAITAAAMSRCWKETRPPSISTSVDAARQAELVGDHHLGVAAEDRLAEADQEVGQPEGRHEQDDVGLVDERAQHDPLDGEGEEEHDAEGEEDGEGGRNAALVQADEGQRGEDHHDALGEVEHAGGLEDQDEAERDEGVEHAGDEALPEGLDQEVRLGRHEDEGIDEDVVERVAAGDGAGLRRSGEGGDEEGRKAGDGERPDGARVEAGLARDDVSHARPPRSSSTSPGGPIEGDGAKPPGARSTHSFSRSRWCLTSIGQPSRRLASISG